MPSIPPAAIQGVLAGGEGIQRVLAGEYKSNYVVLAAAEVDTPGKSIVVTVAGQDPAGPFVWSAQLPYQQRGCRPTRWNSRPSSRWV